MNERVTKLRTESVDTRPYISTQRAELMTQFYRENAEVMTRGQVRRLCKEYFLLAGRMREWTEVHRQLVILAREVGIRPQAESATYGRVHRALLSGLLSFVGQREARREYRTGRGGGFFLSKGSRVDYIITLSD